MHCIDNWIFAKDTMAKAKDAMSATLTQDSLKKRTSTGQTCQNRQRHRQGLLPNLEQNFKIVLSLIWETQPHKNPWTMDTNSPGQNDFQQFMRTYFYWFDSIWLFSKKQPAFNLSKSTVEYRRSFWTYSMSACDNFKPHLQMAVELYHENLPIRNYWKMTENIRSQNCCCVVLTPSKVNCTAETKNEVKGCHRKGRRIQIWI